MEGDQTGNSDRELTSTMGRVMSTTSKNEEKAESSDATPTSSTDASTTPNASQIVSDDPISSTSSDIDQKSKNTTVMSNSKESSCDAEADLLEMSMMAHTSSEKITENVEDLVQDLETLLGESTDSFNLSRKNSEEVSNEKATSSNIFNLDDISIVTECDDAVKSDNFCDKNSQDNVKENNGGDADIIQNVDQETFENVKDTTELTETAAAVEEVIENVEEVQVPSEQLPVLEVEESIIEKPTQDEETEVSCDIEKGGLQETQSVQDSCEINNISIAGTNEPPVEVSELLEEETEAPEDQVNEEEVQQIQCEEPVQSPEIQEQVQENCDKSENEIVQDFERAQSEIQERVQESCDKSENEIVEEIEQTQPDTLHVQDTEESPSGDLVIEEIQDTNIEQSENQQSQDVESSNEEQKDENIERPVSEELLPNEIIEEQTENEEPSNFQNVDTEEFPERDIECQQDQLEISEITQEQEIAEDIGVEGQIQEEIQEADTVGEFGEKMPEEIEPAAPEEDPQTELVQEENTEGDNECISKPDSSPIQEQQEEIVDKALEESPTQEEAPSQLKEIIEIQEITEESNTSAVSELVIEPTVIEEADETAEAQAGTSESAVEQSESVQELITISEITEEKDIKEIEQQVSTPQKIEEPIEDAGTTEGATPSDITSEQIEENAPIEETEQELNIPRDKEENPVEQSEYIMEKNKEEALDSEEQASGDVPNEDDCEGALPETEVQNEESKPPVEIPVQQSDIPLEESQDKTVDIPIEQPDQIEEIKAPIEELEAPIEQMPIEVPVDDKPEERTDEIVPAEETPLAEVENPVAVLASDEFETAIEPEAPIEGIYEDEQEEPVPSLQLDEESDSVVAPLELPIEIGEPLVDESIPKDEDQVEEPNIVSSVELPPTSEEPMSEEFGTEDTESLREEQILPQEPLPDEIGQTEDEIEPVIEEPLVEGQATPTEDLPDPADEPDETMMAIAGLESDKLNEVFQERQLSEKEIREMEALRMAVASITEETDSYSVPEEIFQESSTEVPVVEEVVLKATEAILEEQIQTLVKDNKGNGIDVVSEGISSEEPPKSEDIHHGIKHDGADNNKLSEPLRISVDDDDKEEDLAEEPSSSKIPLKSSKTAEEEVTTTSHSETDEYKGSLKMTITKKSDRMHSSILKVYNADECEQEPANEEPIPKLIIKPKIQQVEQQHSPKISTRSTSRVASPTSSQRCGSPRMTIKTSKSDAVSPLKITIKPVVNLDDNSKKHSPKLKDESKNRLRESEQSPGPKITIKPIPKPADIDDTPPTTPKLTIKPIKRQDENEEERSSPKITIKPVLKPDDQETTERVSSPKISIKPLVKPAEDEEKERIVLKINKGNIPTPSKESKKREHSPEDEKSERLPKMKLKFSKEGGHPQIVQESNKRPSEDRSTPEKTKKRKSEKVAEDEDIRIVENLNSPIVISDDSRSQHSAEGTALDGSITGTESSVAMEISRQTPEATTPTIQTSPAMPKKRGRPRKYAPQAPLEVRPELPDAAPAAVAEVVARTPAKEKTPPPPAVYDSGRPKRSCRGQNVIATLGIKPRKSRGRGRGAKVNMGTREPMPELAPAPVPMKPQKEPRLTKAKLRLMHQQAKKQLEEERRLEEIIKIKEEARKQLEEQRRREEEAKKFARSREIEIINLEDSQQSEDLETELKRKSISDEVIIIPDEEDVIKTETPPQKKSKSDRRRGKRQKMIHSEIEHEPIITEDKLRKLEISLTPLSASSVEIKPPTPVVAPQMSEPPTPTSSSEITEIVLVDEETRMSADTSSRAQTPAKQVLAPSETIEESQSSSATTESGKAKPSKTPRLEIHQESSTEVVTAEQLAEYNWNNQGPFMIQEQVAQYLGIKSFKRKYPNIPRRTVDMQERDFIKETCLVAESMCDLGLTAVSSADILDIMYSDFQDKYEEYCKHQRDRQAKELINKQRALTLAASLEKNKADLTEQAIHSAAAWNANFNKERKEQRKAAVDLQTFTVQYPKGKMKQAYKPKIGSYPVALVPGQFTDYYREYTPTEINNLPINTMLYDPINIQPPDESESEMSSSSDSESSSSDSESSGSSSSSDDCKACTTQTTVAKRVAAK